MAESATPHAPRPKKRVTRTQARNRRIIALLLLALFVFLIRKGCVACVHSHNDKNNTAAVTTTTTEETTTVPEPASILPETTAPEPTTTIPQTTATDPPTSEYLISGDLPTTYSMEVDPILQFAGTADWLRNHNPCHAAGCSWIPSGQGSAGRRLFNLQE